MTMPAKNAPRRDIRADFPILSREVNGRPVAYLDSAASAQKPLAVIEAMDRVMREHYSNVHRGVYTFGAKTSAAYEDARAVVARFLGAGSEREIVFTRNATEAINLVAATWGRANVGAGDEIILTELEHHANIVPWHMLAKEKGAVLRAVPVQEDGSLDMDAFENMLSPRVKMVAVTQLSNALGTVTSVADIAQKAHAAGAKVLVDGAQGVLHLQTDVRALGCDFYAFTGHKIYGPTGIGALWARAEVLEAMPPYQGGGEMIDKVTFENVTYREAPWRFEAGTPPIVEAIGLAAAIGYYAAIAPAAHGHERELLAEAEQRLHAVEGVRIWSRARRRAAILSFTMDRAHPHDIATVFDEIGLAVRAGHHCCQPLMQALGVSATVRASFAAYSTMEDVDRLAEGVEKVRRIFR